MPNDTRSPAEIEREIEAERAGLRSTLDDLNDTFSPETIMRTVTEQFRTNGGDFSRSIGRAARDNPLALTLTGVGLAWMIFGDRRPPSSRPSTYDDDRFPEGSRHAAMASSGGVESPRSTLKAGPVPAWAQDDDDDGPGLGQRAGDAAHRLGDGVKSAGASVGDAANSAGSSIGNGARSARDGVRDAAHRTGEGISGAYGSARDGIASGAAAGRDRAAAMRARLSQGTEDLSEEARNRIIAARERALVAREQAGRAFSKGSDKAADFYEEHPLVAGALALAVGAAIAGALPRTRREDQAMGAYSDQLIDEAERVYREERDKAARVASHAAGEASKAAREMKDEIDQKAPGDRSAAEATADSLRDKTRKVAESTQEKAEDEKLGQPS